MGTVSTTELALQTEIRQLRARIADLERQLQVVDVPNGVLPAAEKRNGIDRPLGDGEALKWHDSEDKRYRMLFETMLEGFCLVEVIFDSDGKPADYRFLEVNASFESQTGLKNAKGRLMRELAPDHEADWFEIYGQVALTGQPVRFVNEAKALNRWYDVSAYRVGGPESCIVGILFNDITAARQAEEALREGEQRLTAHMDNSPLALIEFDPQFRVIRWSKGAKRIFGWSSAEIVGRAISEVPWVFEEDADLVRQVSQDMLDGKRTRNVSVNRNCHKDGSVVYCEWYNSAIYGVDGKLNSISSQVLNVTDRKCAEQALRESEGRFAFALEVAQIGAWGLDLVSHTAWRSPQHDRVFGYPDLLPEWTYEMFLDHVLAEDREEVDRKFQQALASGADWQFECRIRRADGAVRWIWAQGRSSCGEEGKPLRMSGIMQDITARKRAEEALRPPCQ